MIQILVVGLGGFIGAVARYGITMLVHRCHGGAFPLGTLAVNVTGCLILGFLMPLLERDVYPNTRPFLLAGLLGSFTTFSAFGQETLALLRQGETTHALQNVAANVVIGILAVAAGSAAARALTTC
jgi:CrcB protein